MGVKTFQFMFDFAQFKLFVCRWKHVRHQKRNESTRMEGSYQWQEEEKGEDVGVRHDARRYREFSITQPRSRSFDSGPDGREKTQSEPSRNTNSLEVTSRSSAQESKCLVDSNVEPGVSGSAASDVLWVHVDRRHPTSRAKWQK